MAAVLRNAAETTQRLGSDLDATQDSPYSAGAQRPEIGFGERDASAEVLLDQPLRAAGQGERDLQRVVGAEDARRHPRADGGDDGVERGRAAGGEVLREPARALTDVGQQEAVEVRLAEREVEEVVEHPGELALEVRAAAPSPCP